MRISDDRLETGSARVMCPKCEHLFRVKIPEQKQQEKKPKIKKESSHLLRGSSKKSSHQMASKNEDPTADLPSGSYSNISIPKDLPGSDTPPAQFLSKHSSSLILTANGRRAKSESFAHELDFDSVTESFDSDDPDKSIFDEESALLDLALLNSGYDEPSEGENNDIIDPSTRHRASIARVRSLNVGADAARKMAEAEASGTIGTILGTILIVLFTLMAIMMFITAKNDWTLDFRDFDQMLGVAFKGEVYQPRHVQVVRMIASEGRWIEEVLEENELANEIEIQPVDISLGAYQNQTGTRFFLVSGKLENQTENDSFRLPLIHFELVDRDGEVVFEQNIPAGENIEQPILEEIETQADIDALYADITQRAADVELSAGFQIPFTAIILAADLHDPESLSFNTSVFEAQIRTPNSCWSIVHYERAE